MMHFDVYSRQGCHLCEVLIESLDELLKGRATMTVHDVDSRDDWRVRFGLRVPVVRHRDRTVSEFALDRGAIESVLAEKP
ncbi:MAG: glutaredoxin family protein [Gammaproteobacteria bacterium]|nr:glutaredoxin family protein [Gammaproteobacteria bacterium]NNC76884.1 glutaredoxin family protein [Woeseiaceae bacterium]